MRPRFSLPCVSSKHHLLAALEEELGESDECTGQVFRDSAVVCPVKQHTWSPHLHVTFIEEGEEVEAYGRFAPHPSIWTLFMATYFVLGLLGMAATLYGTSLLMMDKAHWLWWMLGGPASVLAIAFIFGASLIGQGLGADEMHVLRRLVEKACDRATLHANDGGTPGDAGA